MKKLTPIMIALFMLILPLNVYATSSRMFYIVPSITFNGTLAKCNVSVTADNMSDSIQISVKLLQGSTCIATWNDSGNGFLNFSSSKSVTKGKEYTLSVEAIIGGVKQPIKNVSGVCK